MKKGIPILILIFFASCKSPTSSSTPTMNGNWVGVDTVGLGAFHNTYEFYIYSLTLSENTNGIVQGTGSRYFVYSYDTTYEAAITVNGTDKYPTVSLNISDASGASTFNYTGEYADDDLINGIIAGSSGRYSMNLKRKK